ncbi:MAG: peptidylprolyl isomerase [Abditibacteriota bacterium]|nr:peptidylprolyl isomerase [Abditibacteriota bacterium]
MSIQDIRTQFRDHFRWIAYAIAGIFIIGAIWQFGAAPQMRKETDEDIIAKVGKEPLTRDEFDKTWAQASENASRYGMNSTKQLADYKQQVFLQMVQSKKLIELAEKSGIKIKEKDIDAKLDEIIVEQLKQNRQAVLGKISKEQEKLDPRKDKAYLSELSKNGMSINTIVEQVKSMNDRSAVKAQIAAEKFGDIMKAKADAVTDADIENSYTVYKIREIFIPSVGGEEQASAKADKIYKEALAGTDFAKLAKENSGDGMKNNGGAYDLSFDTQYMLGTEVYDAVTQLEKGKISPVIKSDRGYYIVKLEDTEKKLPEKFDKKAKDERKEQLKSRIQYTESSKLQKELMSTTGVTVKDKEYEGYWHLFLAQMGMGDEDTMKKEQNLALACFEAAYKADPSNDCAAVKYVECLKAAGKTDEAGKLLYTLLNGESSMVQGADLNMELAEYLNSKGDAQSKEEALKQYLAASDAAIDDIGIHTQLKSIFTNLGKADLAAKEAKWIETYNAQMEEQRAKEEAARAKAEAEQKAKEAADKAKADKAKAEDKAKE